MPKKMVKKKKVKIFRLLLLLVIVALFFFAIYFYIRMPINNVVITGTTHLRDDDIMTTAGIKNYPAFWLISPSKIKKDLMKNPYIESVEVERRFFNMIRIKVKENNPLFFNESNNELVFGNKDSINKDEVEAVFRVPRLLNYVPDDQYKRFIKEMNKINRSILGKISEIEYSPNEFDKDRFLLYMDDGNMVYLTLTKWKQIDYYNEVIIQLEGRRGILFLDSGNHFKIME